MFSAEIRPTEEKSMNKLRFNVWTTQIRKCNLRYEALTRLQLMRKHE
jgi:hypothetical protein